MRVEGVGGFNFCTTACYFEPDADLDKRVSVTPDVYKYIINIACLDLNVVLNVVYFVIVVVLCYLWTCAVGHVTFVKEVLILMAFI